MPTNLPPEYFEIDKRYRAARTVPEKIACLEELLSVIPKHKGTEKLIGDLRGRLARLRTAPRSRKTGTRHESVFHIDKEGAGQVAVVGTPNVGKSALVRALTNATPEVADYPFTTWEPTPGMMPLEDVQVQLVDTPPLNREYVEGELYNLIRGADLILLVVDLQTDPLQQLDDAVALLEEHGVVPRRLRDQYTEERRLAFVPMLVVANKDDDASSDENLEIFRALLEDDWPVLGVSTTTGRGLEQLKQAVFDRLEIIRIYAKPPGKDPDFSAPFVIKKGGTVEDLAAKIHRDILDNLKLARVWGSGLFDGQTVSREYVLQDKDIVELHT